MTTICGTGHRPGKNFDYSPQSLTRLTDLAGLWLDANLPEGGTAISGMALGWDQALAAAAIQRRQCGIVFHAYIPFIGQEYTWPRESQARYTEMLTHAQKLVVCSEGDYTPEAMQKRNVRMVDASSLVLALWDGSPGGTGNCIRYARKRKKEIVNLWELYRYEA